MPRGRSLALHAAWAVLLTSTLAMADGRRQRVSRRAAGPPYTTSVRSWHTPDPAATAPVDTHGRPELVLYSLNTRDRVTLPAASEAGGFAASDLDAAARVLREPSSGNQYPLEPRLADVVYRIQTHFEAQEIRVISAYRTPHGRGRGSNHGRGRAINLIVPGASDADVATFARELGFVGVGVYPTSGFVHVDVRDRSYFWIDSSGPGTRNRERGILADLAKASDREAALRGEKQLGPALVSFDVDAALRQLPLSPSQASGPQPPTAPPAPSSDDDDDEATGD